MRNVDFSLVFPDEPRIFATWLVSEHVTKHLPAPLPQNASQQPLALQQHLHHHRVPGVRVFAAGTCFLSLERPLTLCQLCSSDLHAHLGPGGSPVLAVLTSSLVLPTHPLHFIPRFFHVQWDPKIAFVLVQTGQAWPLGVPKYKSSLFVSFTESPAREDSSGQNGQLQRLPAQQAQRPPERSPRADGECRQDAYIREFGQLPAPTHPWAPSPSLPIATHIAGPAAQQPPRRAVPAPLRVLSPAAELEQGKKTSLGSFLSWGRIWPSSRGQVHSSFKPQCDEAVGAALLWTTQRLPGL